MLRSENTQRLCLFLAWVISIIAVLVTLYASEIAKMPVCHLCWYQRISLYPLAIILGIAIFRDDRQIVIYALPLVLIAALFALYQYLEQMLPGFMPINFCTMGPSCAEVTFRVWGFVTFPFLSLIACVAMSILLILAKPKTQS